MTDQMHKQLGGCVRDRKNLEKIMAAMTLVQSPVLDDDFSTDVLLGRFLVNVVEGADTYGLGGRPNGNDLWTSRDFTVIRFVGQDKVQIADKAAGGPTERLIVKIKDLTWITRKES